MYDSEDDHHLPAPAMPPRQPVGTDAAFQPRERDIKINIMAAPYPAAMPLTWATSEAPPSLGTPPLSTT